MGLDLRARSTRQLRLRLYRPAQPLGTCSRRVFATVLRIARCGRTGLPGKGAGNPRTCFRSSVSKLPVRQATGKALRSSVLPPSGSQEVGGHLGPAFTGKHTLVVERRRSHHPLPRLEVGEVPDVQTRNPRSLRRDIECHSQHVNLVLLGEHLRRLAVMACDRVRPELGNDDGLCQPLVQRVQFLFHPGPRPARFGRPVDTSPNTG